MWPQPRATLFPYTTLFRSCAGPALIVRQMLLQPASRSRIRLSPCRDHPSFSNAFFLPEFGAFSCLGVGQCSRSEEHTSELQSRGHLVCRLLLDKKNTKSKS